MLKVDLVSPLPPVRSGIADYSRDLLPHLEELCELRVIGLPGQEVLPAIRERWPVLASGAAGEGGRLPLYQMGNNRYHEGVLELALERPGILTLHDLVLHHLLVETTLGRADLEAYRRRLTADHGWIGKLTGQARQWGELGSATLFELPAHRTVLRRQRGILVHSAWAASELTEEDPDLAVRRVPMGVPLGERVGGEAAAGFRRRHGLPADRPLLGSFGFQTPIKRTEVVIRALALPALRDAHLVIVGEASGVLDLAGLAAEAGVSDRVHVTGFIDFRDFETAIAASDLCVNLRYPTAGETSASLLRVLAVGRPVAVSDYAQFSELPDELAVKVPLGDGEAEQLAERVGELLALPDRLREMGEAARSYVRRHHDPAAAAARIIEACGELAELDPPGDEAPAVPPPTSLVWSELEGRLEVQGGQSPWPVGERRRLEIALSNDGFCRWLPTATQPGGVSIELRWRADRESEALSQQWCEVPRELLEGESYRFEVETRRPSGAGQLIVEPHVDGVSGFGALGGPTWILTLAEGNEPAAG
jgi:glycosyltransferase involved in cell wall biosynthesis